MTWLTEQISAVGAWVLNQIVYTGRFGHFSWQVIRKFPASLKRFSIVVQQMMFLGNHSLLIIAVSGFFIGAVLGLVGGIKTYSKFSSGDPDTSKTAASWFFACIFLIVAATILRSFFL